MRVQNRFFVAIHTGEVNFLKEKESKINASVSHC